MVRLLDRLDRAVDVHAWIGRVEPAGARREGAGRQAVPSGELRVGPPQPPVGGLRGPEKLLLEIVRRLLVELLVSLVEARQGERQLIGGFGDVVEELLPCFGSRYTTSPELNPRSGALRRS